MFPSRETNEYFKDRMETYLTFNPDFVDATITMFPSRETNEYFKDRMEAYLTFNPDKVK